MASVMVEEEVCKLGWSVGVGGGVNGRQEIVVNVVIASQHQNNYGLGQVLAQTSPAHHSPQLIVQRALEVHHLLAQAIPLSLCHFFLLLFFKKSIN